MLKRFLASVVILSSLVFSQTDTDIDTLLYNSYKELNPNQIKSSRFHYKCCPITLFPFFALNVTRPYIGGSKDTQCTKGCDCTYSKIVDKTGVVHIIFAGESYFLYGQDKIPSAKTYRVFFYMKQDGRWIQEKEPLSVIFDLVGRDGMSYAPRTK